MKGKIAIIGAGITGLAHAYSAMKNGFSVIVFEKSDKIYGTSVRNFGTLWPIGFGLGKKRDEALRSIKIWKEIQNEADFWMNNCGSLFLSYDDITTDVIKEFLNFPEINIDSFSFLNETDLEKFSNFFNYNSLQGAMFSPYETLINPTEAIPKIISFLQNNGVIFQFNSTVTKINDSYLETNHNKKTNFDFAIICSGHETHLLFANEIRKTGFIKTKLQMLRTIPQPDEFKLDVIAASSLSMRHYSTFSMCPSINKLRDKIRYEMSEYERWGIHVMAVQHPNNSLVIGDSHEYGYEFTPGRSDEIDELIIAEFTKMFRIPNLKFEERWLGFYLKCTEQDTELLLNPYNNVYIVTGMGGRGLTLSFITAEKTLNSISLN